MAEVSDECDFAAKGQCQVVCGAFESAAAETRFVRRGEAGYYRPAGARLVDGEVYFPGYHMNKSHWVTLCLDGRTTAEEICRRLDESYCLAGKK